MRLPHAARASIAGLAAGYLSTLAAAFWLRAAAAREDFLWSLISPFRLAAWMLLSAHGVPLRVRTAAGLDAPEAAGSVGRLSELLGGGSDVVFTFSVLIVPIGVLAVTGAAVALTVRRHEPGSAAATLRRAGAVAAVHGVLLGLTAWASSTEAVFEGAVAPDLGLGAATGRLAVGLGHAPGVAAVLGVVLGAGFAVAGGLSSLGVRATLASDARVVLRGWLRGLGAAAGVVAAVLAAGAIVALVTGRAPGLALFALGGYVLAANAVAAGVLLSHGVSMVVALDAGPFTGWERMDLLHFGAAGSGAPPALVAAAIVPLAAGVVAGRFCARRTSLSPLRIGLRFAALWGLTQAVLALLLRVRVLSSFSVGALDLGGGSAAVDPLVALVVGAAWGAAAGTLGAVTARPAGLRRLRSSLASLASPGARDESLWTCPGCRMPNTDDDRFCVSCGRVRPEPSTSARDRGPGR